MSKTILITGATDGIGLLTSKLLAAQGHKVLLHGRSAAKLTAAQAEVGGASETFRADLSNLSEVAMLAKEILARHDRIDVLINNAGVFKTSRPRTEDGMDIRFVVNTLAPFVLTRSLLPALPKSGRIINLSSAAQAPVDPLAVTGQLALDDFAAYAQSKLAITIWTQELARELPDGPVVVAVNPGSLLASKMVTEGFGVAGNDLGIGAEILSKAALDPSFAKATGRYFDNDAGRFSMPDPAAQSADHVKAVMLAIEQAIAGCASAST